MDVPVDLQQRLRWNVELMAECAVWALKTKEAMEAGNRGAADRYSKRAESFLAAAKELEP